MNADHLTAVLKLHTLAEKTNFHGLIFKARREKMRSQMLKATINDQSAAR